MGSCACGNAVDYLDPFCARCKALQTLGLESGATRKQIESTYRLLVKVWHPDRFQSDPALRQAAEERLKSINHAHSYLISNEGERGARSSGTNRRKRAQPRGAAQPEPDAGQPGIQPTGRTQRPIGWGQPAASGIAMRMAILVGGLVLSGAALGAVDACLSANSNTASVYRAYRNGVWQALEAQCARAWSRVEEGVRRLKPVSRSPASAPAAQTVGTNSSEQRGDVPFSALPHVPMPYVTLGLTKDEVIEVMGTPTSSSGDALTFGHSVFYFRNGTVAGWKVDPSLIPLRVKLWPGHFDPDITSFTVGSSKNDVIAVQGTPTLLTENKLGYGASEVFFENGKVTGWKDDRASEPLRTTPAR